VRRGEKKIKKSKGAKPTQLIEEKLKDLNRDPP
jgi:hypothetical protein